ncbi:unnamed protein product [Notodromas monacha]|uniref:Uncharacterized protein n=1 Tax=Notodromas monacha TaxID=399045 RepID=A0A7R9G8Z9_9CRUS|nr:unnamed protein product [Notodromas monacha]CAG0912618.1 unnamed protein product [Notodromas monacha]
MLGSRDLRKTRRHSTCDSLITSYICEAYPPYFYIQSTHTWLRISLNPLVSYNGTMSAEWYCKRDGGYLAPTFGPNGLPTMTPALSMVLGTNASLGLFACGSDAALEDSWLMCGDEGTSSRSREEGGFYCKTPGSVGTSARDAFPRSGGAPSAHLSARIRKLSRHLNLMRLWVVFLAAVLLVVVVISRQTMLGGILQDTPSWLLGLPLAWHHPQQQQQSTPTATPTLPAPPSAPPPPPQRTQIGAPGIPLSSPDLQNHLLHHRLHKDPDDLFSASGHTLHQHQQNHHHQAAPVSRTYQYRKVMKPLLERKRRARINRCLDELKELMVTALQAEGENVAKLEKADVLELTVSHLRKLRRQQQTHHSNQNQHQQQQQQSGTNTAGQLLTNGGKSDDDEEERFRAGFARCASEVSSFLARHWCPPGGAEAAPALSSRLLGHLAHCVRSLHSVACGSGGNPTGSGVMAPAVSWFPSSEAVAAAAAAAAAQDTPLCLAPNSRSMWRPW